MLFVLVLLLLVLRRYPRRLRIARRHPQRQFIPGRRFSSKPSWVPEEVIRLKALMPEAGCRLIAATFNRRLRPTLGETVSKSYVAELLRQRAYEVQVLRRWIKNRRPREVPRNLVWGVDLTTHADATGMRRHVLAIIDHASRAALALEALPDKSRRTVLPILMRTFRLYGRPRFIRTDNERIFSGFGFWFTLLLLGVRRRPTEIGCPWQNGRVERLFGTLKAKLRAAQVISGDHLVLALRQFRFWYNHVRPHQNLGALTPAEHWAGLRCPARFKREYWFDAWECLLQGYYLQR